VTAFAYVLASFIYGSIGILGAIGIAVIKFYILGIKIINS
jgi:hypothetical protein